LRERFGEDALGALELAEVRERGAEVAREANVERHVLGIGLVDLAQAGLEQLDRPAVLPHERVRARERRERIRPVERRQGARVERLLEVQDGTAGIVQLRRDEAEADLGLECRANIARVLRLPEQLEKRLVRGLRLSADTQSQLGVGEPELPLVDGAELGARLEVLRGNLELAGERPERLHGRPPRAGLDPRDVRVRDARAGELALRHPAREAQAAKSDPDRLSYLRHVRCGS
jgi:hypothetical protein